MKLTKSSLSQLMKCKSLKCTFRNKRKAQIQPCGDVYSSIYGYFNLEDDYDENLHNKNDSRFDIISVEEYMSKYFNGDKLGSYEDSPITYVHNNMEKFNRVIADLEAKFAESEEQLKEELVEKKGLERALSTCNRQNDEFAEMIKKLVNEKEELKQQLAEKDEEIAYLTKQVKSLIMKHKNILKTLIVMIFTTKTKSHSH